MVASEDTLGIIVKAEILWSDMYNESWDIMNWYL